MKKQICLFPGQGAQYAGMGQDLYAASVSVQDVFTAASAAAGRDLKDLIFNGSEEDLKNTRNTQVAITLVSISAYTLLKERGYFSGEDTVPGFAGFSLGELSAYHAAGMYDLDTLFKLADIRGNLMADAAEEVVAEQGELGMAAVIGKGFDEINAVIRESGLSYVYPSNDNGPKQVVIAGLKAEIDKVTALLKEAGTRRVIPLKVSAPFHTPFLKKASERFSELISGFSFSDPVHAVYTNVDGGLVASAAEARSNLCRQQISPVRWTTTMENIVAAGDLSGCCEVGPGKVLSGLWKHSGSDIPCKRAGTVENIEKL